MTEVVLRFGKPSEYSYARVPFWADQPDPAQFAARMDAHLAEAQQALDRMLTADGRRTIANTLRAYDDLLLHLDSAIYQTDLIQNVHPDEAFRAELHGQEDFRHAAVRDFLTSAARS